MVWIILGVSFIIFVLSASLRKRWNKLPPGPRGIPFLGNLLQLNRHLHVSFGEWAKEFGPIYTVKFASQRIVVVSDRKMLKELFSMHVFSGKLIFPHIDIILDGNCHGIANTEGPHWEELRHFTLRQLRDFGFGKTSMEDSILLEVNEMVEKLAKLEGKPVTNIKTYLSLAVLNALWFIVSGSRNKQDDPKLIHALETLLSFFTELLESGGLLMFAPWTANWFPNLSGYTKLKPLIQEFSIMFSQPIEEHQATFSESFNRDFIDAFLNKIYTTTDNKSAFFQKLGIENLMSIMGDLYVAGSDTTSSTLSWVLLYMSKFPIIQKKLQDEIEFITVNTRPCSIADRSKMPYTEALIAETLRYSSISAFGAFHGATKDA